MNAAKRKSVCWTLAMVGVNVIVGVGWLLAARFIMSFSQNHEWLSSFVEIAFALNVAVSIRRVAEECVKPSIEIVHRKIDDQLRIHEQKLAREAFLTLRKTADAAMADFEGMELPRLTWCVKIARIASVFAVVALLGYGENAKWVSAVPALLLPPIWFFVSFHIMALRALVDFVDELKGLMNPILRGEAVSHE